MSRFPWNQCDCNESAWSEQSELKICVETGNVISCTSDCCWEKPDGLMVSLLLETNRTWLQLSCYSNHFNFYFLEMMLNFFFSVIVHPLPAAVCLVLVPLPLEEKESAGLYYVTGREHIYHEFIPLVMILSVLHWNLLPHVMHSTCISHFWFVETHVTLSGDSSSPTAPEASVLVLQTAQPELSSFLILSFCSLPMNTWNHLT